VTQAQAQIRLPWSYQDTSTLPAYHIQNADSQGICPFQNRSKKIKHNVTLPPFQTVWGQKRWGIEERDEKGRKGIKER